MIQQKFKILAVLLLHIQIGSSFYFTGGRAQINYRNYSGVAKRREFTQLLTKYNRTYVSAQEREYRYKIFQKNLVVIEKLNVDNKVEDVDHSNCHYSMNKFFDKSDTEF